MDKPESPTPHASVPVRDLSLPSWVFGSLLLILLIGVFFFGPDTLPEYRQRLLALLAALLAGLFGFFLTGDVGLQLNWVASRFGDVGVRATGGLALFVFVLVWWLSPLAPVQSVEPSREEKQRAAWQILHAAHGQPGDGGRAGALEQLARDSASLANIDLSGAHLSGIRLADADLAFATFRGATLTGAVLQGANLQQADFSCTDVRDATRFGVDLRTLGIAGCTALLHADLRGAFLHTANLQSAILSGADLRCNGPIQSVEDAECTEDNRTDLTFAYLRAAELDSARLQGADFTAADLRGASLVGTDWPRIGSIKHANVAGAHPEAFRHWAVANGAIEVPDDSAWAEYRSSIR